MDRFNVLKEYYIRYLREVRENSESTVNHYLGALNSISKYLVDHAQIQETIYEIGELEELESVRSYLFSQPDFVEKDDRGNRMYSAGLNNYVRFAMGEDFFGIDSVFAVMDMEVPISSQTSAKVERWRRNGIIKTQSIEMAHYLCELDSNHKTFTAASTGRQYMEGHHAIPIKRQNQFSVSLDIYANIVCLCPICHRLLHYGVDTEKEGILNRLYKGRSDRLANSGIRLSRDEFIEKAKA